MIDYGRSPRDVIGNNPIMMAYWDQMPDEARRYLLSSNIQIPTLGELELMNEQLKFLTEERPPLC